MNNSLTIGKSEGFEYKTQLWKNFSKAKGIINNIKTTETKKELENIDNIQIKRISESIYSIDFDCVMKDELLNKKYNVHCHTEKSFISCFYKKNKKVENNFSIDDFHLLFDFQCLFNSVNNDAITFTVKD